MPRTDAAGATPNLDKIATGNGLEGSDEVCWALREILPAAEDWVGRDIVLECDRHGWSIRFTHGNNYRDRLTDRYGYRFPCAEDAIQALVDLIAKNKDEYERAEAGANAAIAERDAALDGVVGAIHRAGETILAAVRSPLP